MKKFYTTVNDVIAEIMATADYVIIDNLVIFTDCNATLFVDGEENTIDGKTVEKYSDNEIFHYFDELYETTGIEYWKNKALKVSFNSKNGEHYSGYFGFTFLSFLIDDDRENLIRDYSEKFSTVKFIYQ